uniref:Replicase large subunit n=1 Tax=Atrato Virga-like virus 7 TaxID=2689346 RepID=A0A6B9KGC4_9VIRU|nr:polyprotein [Atrato Virga-like virus 7]
MAHMENMGYCYLGLVEDLGAQMGWTRESIDTARGYMVEALGSYPAVPALIDYLIKHFSYAYKMRVYHCDHRTGFILHYPSSHMGTMDLADFITYYAIFKDFAIGADRAVYIDGTKVMQQLGINTGELVKRALNQLVPGDAIADLATSAVVSQIDKAMDTHKNDRVIRLPFMPSLEIRHILETSYDHYTLKFEGGTTQHAYAAASREIETEWVLDRIRYRNDNPPGEPWDAHFVDVGGNWITHFDRGRKYVHSCTPLLGANDAKRSSDRRHRLQSREAVTNTQLQILKNVNDKFTTDCNPLFCLRKGQDCNVKARYCVFIHSVYDMSNKDIANIMDAHDSLVGYGTFIFSPEILIRLDVGSKGHIPVYNVNWEIEVSPNMKKQIRFSFQNDSSYNYVHNLKNFVDFAVHKHLVSDKGNSYMVEMLNNVNGTQYFKITKLVVAAPADELITHSWWLDEDDRVTVTYYILDPNYHKYGRRKLQRKTMTVNVEYLTALMQYATRANDAKFTIADLFNYACSLASRVIINGTVVTSRSNDFTKDINYQLLELVQFVFVRTYEKKYENGLVIQEVLDKVKRDRKLSILRLLYDTIFNKLKEFVKDIFYGVFDFLLGSLIYKTYDYAYGITNGELRFTTLIKATSSADNIVGTGTAYVDNVIDCCSLTFTEEELYNKLSGGAADMAVAVGRATCAEEGDLIREVVLGDGHCQFHAINAVLGKKHKDGLAFRRHLVTTGKNGVPAVIKDENAWGDEDSLEYVARTYGVRFCVHIDPKVGINVERFRLFGSTGKFYHLEYSGNHYNALLKPEDINPDKDEPLFLGTEGGSPLSVPGQLLAFLGDPKLVKQALFDLYKQPFSESFVRTIETRLTALKNLSKYTDTLKPFVAAAVQSQCKQVMSKYNEIQNKSQLLNILSQRKLTIKSGRNIFEHTPIKLHGPGAPNNNIGDRYTELSGKSPLPGPEGYQKMSEEIYMLETREIIAQLIDKAGKPARFRSAVGKVTKENLKKQLEKNKEENDADSKPKGNTQTTDNKNNQESDKKKQESDNKKKNSEANKNKNKDKEQNKPRDSDDKKSKGLDDNKSVSSFTTRSSQRKTDNGSLVSETSQMSSTYDNIKAIRQEIKALPDNIYDLCIPAFKPAFTGCLNRSQAKLRNVLSQTGIKAESALDLCSGPGGFVMELSGHCKKVYAVFYGKAEKGALMSKKISSLANVELLKINADNDLLQSDFKTEFAKRDIQVELVTADGCIHDDMTIDPEGDNQLLITQECSIGVTALRPGGSMIVKFFDLCSTASRNLVKNVAVNFESVEFIRSDYSSKIGGEIYVCFINRVTGYDFAVNSQVTSKLRRFVSTNNRNIFKNLNDLRGDMYKKKSEEDRKTSENREKTQKEKDTLEWVNRSFEEQEQNEQEKNEQTTQPANTDTISSDTSSDDHVSKVTSTLSNKPPTKDVSNVRGFLAEKFQSKYVGVINATDSLPGIGAVAIPGSKFEVIKLTQYHLVVHYSELVDVVNWFEQNIEKNITVNVLNPKELKFPSVNKHSFLSYRDKRLPSATHSEISSDREKNWAKTGAYGKMWGRMDGTYEISRIPSRQVYCRNAVRERIESWSVSKNEIRARYDSFYKKIMSMAPRQNLPEKVRAVRELFNQNPEDYGLIKDRKYVIYPSDAEFYEKGYDGKEFINLKFKHKDCLQLADSVPCGYILVGKSTKLMQDDRLFSCTKDLEPLEMYIPSITLRSGVPGCGKTKRIIDSVTENDFIVTSTRENKDDIISRCEKMKKRTKTIHSLIINKDNVNVEVNKLYIDEALMSHAGEIMIAINVLRPTEVIMSGDEQQIPYINRLPFMESRCSDATRICNNMCYDNQSYRVPRDVAFLFTKNYRSGFITTKEVMRSMDYKLVNSPDTIPVGEQVLVFKQTEKNPLRLLGHVVSTVHEYQGKQAETIYMYRDSIYPLDPIYRSAPHILVALTRHSKKLVYYTRIRDEITALIDKAKQFTEQDLRDKLAGGGSNGMMVENFRYAETDYGKLLKYGMSYDVPRYQMVKDVAEERRVRFTRNAFKRAPASVPALQTWFDHVLPGVSTVDKTHDNYLIHNDPLSINVAGKLSIDMTKAIPKPKTYDMMKPNLRTSMGLERIRSLRESLLAYVKRNDAVPPAQAPVDPTAMVNMMIELFKGFFDQEKLNNVASFPINLTSESIYKWSKAQDRPVDLDMDEYLTEVNLSVYDFMIKPRAKPDLTPDSYKNYPALQTIASQPLKYNQLLCPIIKDLKEKILTCLLPKFKIFSDVTIDEFAGVMNSLYPLGFDNGSKIYEFDVSKYDKSQDELALLFDAAVMRMFGISEEVIQLWISMHTVTELVDYKNGMKARVVYQRKSGDPFTFLGNTVFLMGCVSLVVPLQHIEFAAFGGDDQVIVTKFDIDLTSVMMFENTFNLEVKLFERRYGYFCSKFLIYSNGRWYFLPDLLKMITKFGRHDLRNPDHVEEYRVSMCDLLSVYNDTSLVPVFNEAFNERYPSPIIDHSHVISLVLELVRSRDNFSKLYYTKAGDKLCMDPSRPDINK